VKTSGLQIQHFFLKNVSLNSNLIWHVVTCQAFGDLNWFLDDPVCTGPRIYRANGEENLTYDELLSHHGGCLKNTKRTFLKSFTHCFREAGLYFSCRWSAAGTKLSSILIERVTDPRRKNKKTTHSIKQNSLSPFSIICFFAILHYNLIYIYIYYNIYIYIFTYIHTLHYITYIYIYMQKNMQERMFVSFWSIKMDRPRHHLSQQSHPLAAEEARCSEVRLGKRLPPQLDGFKMKLQTD